MKQYLLFYGHPLQLPTKLFYPLCLNFQGFFRGGGDRENAFWKGHQLKVLAKIKKLIFFQYLAR